jgi:acetyl-CoA C-acetyltransferase
MPNNPIVIVGAKRTPMGALGGKLKSLSATDLGGVAIKGALAQGSVPPEKISSVFMGCVLSAGLGQSPARQASLKAGISYHTTTTHLNKVCGSALQAVFSATQELLTQPSEGVVVAGGMESMTNAPYLITKARQGYRLGHGTLIDHLFFDGIENASDHQLMGAFAEYTAEKYSLTRKIQDDYAQESVSRTLKALKDKTFDEEIIPVFTEGEMVSVDEPPLRIKIEKIPTLKPAFSPQGTVTAASSSALADGSSALVVTHLQTAQKEGWKPLAVIRGISTHAQEPEWFTTAPIEAISKLATQTGWLLSDVDLFEINEAFAVVPLAVMKSLNIPFSKVNIFGGACSLGHPLGASGVRIVITLLNGLQKKNLKKGIAALCIGGGEAMAIAIERLV